MTVDIRSCSVCAWRRDCKKRFSGGDDMALRCVEFEPDVTLRKGSGENKTDEEEEAEPNVGSPPPCVDGSLFFEATR